MELMYLSDIRKINQIECDGNEFFSAFSDDKKGYTAESSACMYECVHVHTIHSLCYELEKKPKRAKAQAICVW